MHIDGLEAASSALRGVSSRPSKATAAGCRSTASWRWRCTRRAWATTPTARRKFGAMPSSGSDFVTAPEMTPLFGRALAVQVRQALAARPAPRGLGIRRRLGRAGRCSCSRRWATRVQRYTIVDLSGSLRARQQRGAGARSATGCTGSTRCPSASTAWSSATRCSTRCRCKLLARIGGALARARRASRATRGRLRLGRPADRAAAAGRGRGRARLPDRDPSAGRGLRRAPWPTGWAAARRSSSTTASPSTSTTTRSAHWAR